jgi:hypothetical protein
MLSDDPAASMNRAGALKRIFVILKSEKEIDAFPVAFTRG